MLESHKVACLFLDGWMDGYMDGRVDGWMDGWMDGWVTLYSCYPNRRLFKSVNMRLKFIMKLYQTQKLSRN